MATTQEKLEQARALLKAKKYAQARKLLETIKHPTAKKWLERLDEREASGKVVVKKRRRSGCFWVVIGVLGLFICSVIGRAAGLLPTTEERLATRTAEAFSVALEGTQTQMALPTDTTTFTPTVTLTSTEGPSPTPSLTLTETPTITFTPERTAAPTATITDTPLPEPDAYEAHRLSRWLYRQEGVNAVEVVEVYPGIQTFVYAEIIVYPGYNNPVIPTAFLDYVNQELGTPQYANFNIIISDGLEAIDYTYDLETGNWRPTRLTGVQPPTPRPRATSAPTRATTPTSAPLIVPIQPVQPVAPAGSSCPSLSATCSQLTCSQAYACMRAGNGGLDRDNDGVPCESVCPGG